MLVFLSLGGEIFSLKFKDVRIMDDTRILPVKEWVGLDTKSEDRYRVPASSILEIKDDYLLCLT